jgi:hypothetical protein
MTLLLFHCILQVFGIILIWAPVYSCTYWLTPRNDPPLPAFGLIYEGAISQPRRHLFVISCLKITKFLRWLPDKLVNWKLFVFSCKNIRFHSNVFCWRRCQGLQCVRGEEGPPCTPENPCGCGADNAANNIIDSVHRRNVSTMASPGIPCNIINKIN